MDPSVARILDANHNRAREALRVLEEYARFALDDSVLSERAKSLRHDLAAAIKRLDRTALLAWRDTPGDVGVVIRTEAEQSRASAEDVAAAAAARLSEALRALEEYGKTVDAAFAAAIEAIRYASYTFEKDLRLRVGARQRWRDVRLYVLITESLCTGAWLETAKAALRGGADALQLREKNMADAELITRAEQLTELCRAHNALCIINDRPDIARLVHADGVHVGQDDLPVNAARRIVGGACLVGKSTHTLDQARAAAAEGPDYIAVGPVFATETKPQEHIAGPKTLRAVTAEAHMPVVAIGGITEARLDAVLDAGGRCACVCHAVIGARGVEAAAAALKKAILARVPPLGTSGE